MNFHILTLFPELMQTIFGTSITGRAVRSGALGLSTYNFREWSPYKHARVDDSPYGGGKGMLLMAEPIYNCHRAVMEKILAGEGSPKIHTVYMSPKGSLLTQKKAEELSGYTDLIVVCGHYEGVDERVVELLVDEEISIGDYVLTGGELPCAILADSVARLVPGVLAADECHEEESISSGLLEYPHYTRPEEFLGLRVPEVLQSGDHAAIEKWRLGRSLELTALRRPDLYEAYINKKNEDEARKNL